MTATTPMDVLIVDDLRVARHLIENCPKINDADLKFALSKGSVLHFRMIAARKGLSQLITEAVIETQDLMAISTLLDNREANMSQSAIEAIVALSQTETGLIPKLIRRPELKPSSAYILFWWADAEMRKQILSRFAVNREVMQDSASDVFAMAAQEGWNDPLSRKALQFIERRQRNRAALSKSPYSSLEDAIEKASVQAMSRFSAEEISYLSGIKPSTGAKIFRDAGGEGMAVLCKATGLTKTSLRHLWRALRRVELTETGDLVPALERALYIYDILATDRAQTVLRYWNWSLSTALTSVMLKAIGRGQAMDLESMSVPQRAAFLAFSQDLR